ncbi:MAG: tRNA dihydrouridine synthase [Planctomycetaceae bacterium]
MAGPAVQAALSGYSDRPMRMIAQRYGAAYTIAEVMIDQFVLAHRRGRQRTQHHLLVTDDEHPVGGQLMGSDPSQFGPAALRLVEAGFDVIDINFGCPVKSALGGCRGGYHLSQPHLALEIIERVRTSVPAQIPVTVKMRRGIDGTDESRAQFFEIADGAFQLGAAAITVHGRTVQQRYDGPSNWEFLREVKAHVGERTVIGSGDLFSAPACMGMLRGTGVDGVSIARGAIGNPWIFAQVRALLAGEPLPPPPGVHEQREALVEHYRLAEQTYGPLHCCRIMKKFGIKYARLHPEATLVRDAFVTVKTPEDWHAVISRCYGDNRPGRYPEVDETV